MAVYSTLRRGSRGNDVKKLQEQLISSGYDVGKTGADGIYGANTEAAVKKYQTDNGLTADGIAGNQTFGKLYGSTNNGTSGRTNNNTNNVSNNSLTYAYDPAKDSAYMQALSALQQAQQNIPTYKDSYSAQIQDIYDKIVNRDEFSYDINSDALYQQYRDQYMRQGQLAMEDAMGQAAALTGGYGSSYAQSVGQQAYQSYLSQLNDVIPELYGMALDRYNQEGQDLLNQYAILGDMADDEYAKYQYDVDQYWKNVANAKDDANTAYDRGYTNYWNDMEWKEAEDDEAYERLQDEKYWANIEDEKAYNRKQDALNRADNEKANAYNKVMNLVETGYVPTDAELAAAGFTSAQAAHVKKSAAAYNVVSQAEAKGALFGEFTAKEFYEAMQNAASNETAKDAQALVAAAGYTDAALEVYDIYFGNKPINGGWTSYEDAAKAGFGNILGAGPGEKARAIKQYGSYQKYLDAMYKKYMNQ